MSDEALARFAEEEDVIQGVIVNSLRELDAEITNLLRKSYLGADLSQIWVLDHDSRPAESEGHEFLFWGFGAILLGSILLFEQRRRSRKRP